MIIYEYYIWDENDDSDEVEPGRIEEALRAAGFSCEFNRLEIE